MATTIEAAIPDVEKKSDVAKSDEPKPEVETEVERKGGKAFPVELADGKRLATLGLRRKGILSIYLKIYSFGIYVELEKLKEAMKERFEAKPEKATEETFAVVIDGDLAVTVKMMMVFGGLSMSIVRKSFDEGLGASLKKINGGKKDDELLNKVMGSASDSLKLPSGSEIEITRKPGYILQTKVRGEVVSEVQSELLCRAYFHMYLGEDPFDKDAKDRFGRFLLSLL